MIYRSDMKLAHFIRKWCLGWRSKGNVGLSGMLGAAFAFRTKVSKSEQTWFIFVFRIMY